MTDFVLGSSERLLPDVDAGLGRAFVIGSIVGFFGVLLVCGGIALASGSALWPAVGIGLFAAFWGGPGFGGMMGAVLHYSRTHDH